MGRAGAARPHRARVRARRLAAAAALAVLAGAPAGAVTIDFEDLASGTLVTDQYTSANHPGLASGQGFTVTVNNTGGGVDVASLYDSGLSGGEDPDVEGPPAGTWDGGNLAPTQTPVGNLLIVQESATAGELSAGVLSHPNGLSSQGPGFAPDDEAGGGEITFAFEAPQVAFAFDFVDVDDPAGYEIAFTDTFTGETLVVTFAAITGVAWASTTITASSPTMTPEFGSPSAVKA